MPRGRKKTTTPPAPPTAENYQHPKADAVIRPEVGVQAQFKKKKPPKTYIYDSSLAPEMSWDGINSSREIGEWLITMIEKASRLPPPHRFFQPEVLKDNNGKVLISILNLEDALEHLKKISQPFLNWSGKKEHLSFDVPTLPLFIHERLSTKAILETLKRKEKTQQSTLSVLFGDPCHSITDQVLKAYTHGDKWVNRLILGDSLVVMNSLLQYEGMAGQIQMIYMDPPYGIRFGSNFQPFVRNNEISDNTDDDMTREPEMVKAYRDTWELGIHSYLTYMRDRIRLAWELLNETGSIFIQINDQNIHHIREIMDEIFGKQNFRSIISFKTTSAQTTDDISNVCDYLIWYYKDASKAKKRKFLIERSESLLNRQFDYVETESGKLIKLSEAVKTKVDLTKCRRVKLDSLTSQHESNTRSGPFEFNGKTYYPHHGRQWGTSPEGMQHLVEINRIVEKGDNIFWKRYADEFNFVPLDNLWDDTTATGTRKSPGDEKIYVVQTMSKVLARCILMTTDPGDLVLDPTCGSGTTAYVAEQWGRRWITIDVSRVPLALAKQRLLTALYTYHKLKSPELGPSGGFEYKRKHNSRGEETGGIIPHITLKTIAKDETANEEIIFYRPEKENSVIRITGPFAFEATIPTPIEIEDDSSSTEKTEDYSSFVDRMIEVLRRSPVLHLEGNRTVDLKNIRPPAKALSLSAEAIVKNGDEKPVALVFGPENSAVSERLVFESAREARAKGYSFLYVIGVGAQPNARLLIEQCKDVAGIPAAFVAVTPDIMMGDLLKNMRSSQIFSVCGLPDIKIKPVAEGEKKDAQRFEVELLGLDIFDPITMEPMHMAGNDVPAWFLDTDYNGLCFHVCQAFFPRTGAWDNLKKSLGTIYDDSIWDHLSGATSTLFFAGDHNQIAVKVIDDRGNELMVVRSLQENME